jgi:hypothetical protein
MQHMLTWWGDRTEKPLRSEPQTDEDSNARMKELEDEARAKYEAYKDSVNQDRCESVDDGVRCQLFIHDDDQHAALIFNEIDEWTARRARIQARKADTKLGANRGQRPVPARGLLPWAGDFPRAESNPWRPPSRAGTEAGARSRLRS